MIAASVKNDTHCTVSAGVASGNPPPCGKIPPFLTGVQEIYGHTRNLRCTQLRVYTQDITFCYGRTGGISNTESKNTPLLPHMPVNGFTDIHSYGHTHKILPYITGVQGVFLRVLRVEKPSYSLVHP